MEPTIPATPTEQDSHARKFPIVWGLLLLVVVCGVLAWLFLTPKNAAVNNVQNESVDTANPVLHIPNVLEATTTITDSGSTKKVQLVCGQNAPPADAPWYIACESKVDDALAFSGQLSDDDYQTIRFPDILEIIEATPKYILFAGYTGVYNFTKTGSNLAGKYSELPDNYFILNSNGLRGLEARSNRERSVEYIGVWNNDPVFFVSDFGNYENGLARFYSLNDFGNMIHQDTELISNLTKVPSARFTMYEYMPPRLPCDEDFCGTGGDWLITLGYVIKFSQETGTVTLRIEEGPGGLQSEVAYTLKPMQFWRHKYED